VRLTEDEYLDTLEKAKKVQLSIGGFIRAAVKNLEVKEAPSADVLTLIREVRRVVEKLIADSYITKVN